MKITTELLITLHDRIREVCLAKYHTDFDYFRIWDDGSITCYYTSHYQEAEQESYPLEAKDLQDNNLDLLVAERKAKEEAERLKREEDRRIANDKRVIREKEKRRQQFLKLKKEFGENNI